MRRGLADKNDTICCIALGQNMPQIIIGGELYKELNEDLSRI